MAVLNCEIEDELRKLEEEKVEEYGGEGGQK